MDIYSMPEHPESFPVNALVPIKGTPLEDNEVRNFLFWNRSSQIDGSIESKARKGANIGAYYRHCTDCPSEHHHPSRRRSTNAKRIGTNDVFYGWCQRYFHGGKDVDNTL